MCDLQYYILNAQNAVVWHEYTPRNDRATQPLCLRHFVPSHARLSWGAASVHRRREIDKCCKRFHAYIQAKGGHFSI